MLRTMILAVFALLLVNGCSGYRTIQVPADDGKWTGGDEVPNSQTPSAHKMYTQKEEGKYVIKPEPYSLKSKKKDPELLGPQRTYDRAETVASKTTKRKRHAAVGMTKASCISMIGEAKYNNYVKKYGGEKGALRRCLIIKRLRG